ncbi:MAG: PQQ-dependent sugar dehydrogenase [Pseudomonadota bacterium]
MKFAAPIRRARKSMGWLQNLFVRRPAFLLTLVLGALVVAAIGGALAMFAWFNQDRIASRLAGIFGTENQYERPDQQEFGWTNRNTALLSFEVAQVELGDVSRSVKGGGIEAYGDGLVYVSSIGVIGYLDLGTGKISYLDDRVPMDYERVRNDVLFDKPLFQLRYFRVQDIMIRSDQLGQDWLYVSHHVMAPGDEDICQTIHKIELEQTPDGISLGQDGWHHVYTLRQCVNMPDLNWHFIGDQAGGRMVPESPSTFLYSTGTYMLSLQPGGVEMIRSDSSDFGKILEIDSETNTASIYARGVRNPQGLVRTASGDLWETEHGPRGGDEINLLERGVDYGWPLVTYGLDYGPKDWPFSTDQGRHEGFTKPIHAFSVSVAPSELVEVAAESELVRWRGDLLMGSLRAQSLFRMRIENGRLMTMEQMEFGERMRDLTWLENGWLAILTGSSKIILIRSPAPTIEDTTPEPLTIAGYSAVNEIESRLAASLRQGSWGRELFAKNCATCHNLSSEPAPGPRLDGIIGARIAREADYSYSAALEAASGRWTRAKLGAFLRNPEELYSGTAMPSFDFGKYEYRALADYLETRDYVAEPSDN